MVNYKNGKIYKITGTTNDEVELIYIGSTTLTLCQRFAVHKSEFKKKKRTDLTSLQVLACNNCQITLIELYECSMKEELLMRERYYFDIYDCVNKKRPIRFKTESKDEAKEYSNQYYKDNKKQLLEQQKEYREENKERISEKQKEWYDENREQLLEKQKEYRDENREQLNNYAHQYYNDNKELLKNINIQYYYNNKEKLLKYGKNYREWKKISNIYLNILLND
jgi:hypothetical protein